jgi:acyl-CoA reductase-like NAD-dependent aldehyde dehydrogenase
VPEGADEDEEDVEDEDTTDPATYDPEDGDAMAPDLDDALDDAEEAADAGDDMSPEDMRDALRRLTEAVRARRRQQAGPRA